MDEARYRKLLEEATPDAYGEEEEFISILYTLEEQLDFPLRANIAGVPVLVNGLDDQRSGLRRGIVATVERAGKPYHVGLSELEFADLDAQSSEWLEMYRRWFEI